MITISLCMIVKNEESTLGNCLNSVKELVDEIIIADTGSTDRTKEVAAEYAAKIFDFPWIDDFSAARNFSYSHATMDYILWLDADDIILPEDGFKLKKLKECLTLDTDAVMMRYNTGFDGKGRVTFSCYRERLSRRSGGFKWKEPVHEYLDAGWKRITADICITHAKPPGTRSDRNIQIYEKLLERGELLSPRGMYYYGRELKERGRYTEAISWLSKFLDDGQGWIEDNITACGEAGGCYTAVKNYDAALAAMLRSFVYDNPRAEICCQIGYCFQEQQKYEQAAFWFELALNLKPPALSWGFRQEDHSGFIPCLELAVCYDRLKKYKEAYDYNERAAEYKPDASAVLRNREYFKRIPALADKYTEARKHLPPLSPIRQ